MERVQGHTIFPPAPITYFSNAKSYHSFLSTLVHPSWPLIVSHAKYVSTSEPLHLWEILSQANTAVNPLNKETMVI